jgi:hypothetical protein
VEREYYHHFSRQLLEQFKWEIIVLGFLALIVYFCHKGFFDVVAGGRDEKWGAQTHGQVFMAVEDAHFSLFSAVVCYFASLAFMLTMALRLMKPHIQQGEAQDGLGRREPRRAARLPFRRGDQGLGALRFLLRIVSPNDAPIPPEITFQIVHISRTRTLEKPVYTRIAAFCSLLTLVAIDARCKGGPSEGEGAHSSRQPLKDQPLPTTKNAVKQASIAHG